MSHTPLGQICVSLGLLTPAQVQGVLDRLAQRGEDPLVRFGAVATEMGVLDDTGLARALAQQFRLNMVPGDRLEKLSVPPEVLALLPPRLIRDRLLVPTFLEAERRVLSLLCVDPTDLASLRLAQAAAQATRLRLFVAPRGAMVALARRLCPSDDVSDVFLRGAMPPVDDEPEAELRRPLDVVFEPDPDRNAAIRRLDQIEGRQSSVVSSFEQVAKALRRDQVARIFYRRVLGPQVEAQLERWRKAAAAIVPCPVDGFGPTARPGVDYGATRDFWMAITEFVLLAGESRQMDARARLRRQARLARALAEEVGLPEELRDAVAVAALFVDVDELSLAGGMLDARDEGRRFAVSLAVLRPANPPWDVEGLIAALEARLAGQASPGEHLGAEVVYTSRAVVRAGVVDAPDPMSALGADAARHDARVLNALGRVLRRQVIRGRVAAGGQQNARVLVAEREAAVLTALEGRLGEAGYEVIPAGDGEQALELIRKVKPACIVANLRLPRKDGLAVLVEMRREPELRDIPVLLVSDTGSAADVTRGLELGAEDVIAKPLNPGVVLARLRRATSRRGGAAAAISGQLADLALPELIQTLSLGGRSALVLVSGAGETGRIQVREGKLVAASQGGLTGEDAFFRLAALGAGRFDVRFVDEGEHNLSGQTEYLILEALRRRDEARLGG